MLISLKRDTANPGNRAARVVSLTAETHKAMQGRRSSQQSGSYRQGRNMLALSGSDRDILVASHFLVFMLWVPTIGLVFMEVCT